MFHYEHLSELLFHTINEKKKPKTVLPLKKTFAVLLFMEFSRYGNELGAIPSKQSLQVLIKPLRIIHTFQKTSPPAPSGSHLKNGSGCFPPSWGGNGQQSSV